LNARDGPNDNALAVRLLQELIDSGAFNLIGTVGDPIVAEGNLACKAGIPISTGKGRIK
jgi:hypothetical protein